MFIVLKESQLAISIDEIKYMNWNDNFNVIRDEGEPIASIDVFFKDGTDMKIDYKTSSSYTNDRDALIKKLRGE
jgi:hypothetical protein